jgi:pimeloyl-ACP methyl ester carboxylesterase
MDRPEPSNATKEAHLHDGSRLPISVIGEGPPVVLPVRATAYAPKQAAEMERWGADPSYGPALIEGLSDRFTVIAADYEGHRMSHPAPDTLTPTNLAADLLSISDAAGVDRFAYYGYSWLALAGLQLALRTDRLTALVLGGFPPLDGPYHEMLAVTRAAEAMAASPPSEEAQDVTPGDWDSVNVQSDPAQTRQFVTLYEALQDFDDRASLQLRTSRLCFAGENDNIVYGPRWGDVRVAIADALIGRRGDLESTGWTVCLLPGLDHLATMHGQVVLEVIQPFLDQCLLHDEADRH